MSILLIPVLTLHFTASL